MRLSSLQKHLHDCGDIERLHILSIFDKWNDTIGSIRDRRESRQRWVAAIKDNAENGEIALVLWQRDCDCVEGTSRYILDANVATVDKFCEKQLNYAEGPMRFSIQRPSDHYEPYQRDRIAEAHENGHPYAV